MKRIHYLVGMTLLLAGIATMVSAQVSNNNEDGVYKVQHHQANDYVQGEVLFKLKDGQTANVRRAAGKTTAGIASLDAVLSEYGVQEMEQLLPKAAVKGTPRRAKAFNGSIVEERDLTQLYKVSLPEEKQMETMQLVDELRALSEVEFAEPNYKVYLMDADIASSYSSNPYAPSQWYLDDYGVKQLWNKPIINPTRPVIAIIDTGVDLTHPDIAPNLWTNTAEAEGESNYDNDGNGFAGDIHGWDFINNTPTVKDFNMHGTHVAGIAAAANNGIGIIGANPRALIMPVSVMQSDGTGDVATIVKGIDYAVDNGATVLNLSLGTYANSRAMRQALERAYQSAVIVAAAGNDFARIDLSFNCHPGLCSSGVMFPAGYSFVLGVQATTENGSLAGFSNHDSTGPTFSSVATLQEPDGFNYELKAPGTNMLSTIPGGKYKVLQGTSMASPLVAGAISALKMVKNYDTQEILWGDLLHTENIAQAYAVTNRPAELDLMQIQLRNRKELSVETEEDYGGDHEIDAGETVDIYPVIRTTFGAASNIKMKLEMDNLEDPNTVEILTPDWVDFGFHLDAYGKGVSLNPMQLRVASNVADNRHIKMKFTAKCDETNVQYVGTFTLVATNMVKINGLITEDRTLTADHVYLVNENLGIMEGATLTIEPGTRLEFMAGVGLSSFGKLVANGTPEKPIVFTGHHGATWAGIKSHRSTGAHYQDAVLYTNEAKTLFTLLRTEETPIKLDSQSKYVFYSANEINPSKFFYLEDYIEDFANDMTSKQNLLTDPNYLTPAVLKMLSDWENYCSQYPTQYSWEKPSDEYTYNSANISAIFVNWYTFDNPRDTISYCKIDGDLHREMYCHPYMKDCALQPAENESLEMFYDLSGERITVTGNNGICHGDFIGMKNYDNNVGYFVSNTIQYSNIVNNFFGNLYYPAYLAKYSQLHCNNYFNNFSQLTYNGGKYQNKYYSLALNTLTPEVDKSNKPSYLGTSREDIIRPYIYEIGNAPDTYGQIDLSNMRTTPIAEAHGIVWKVLVNGKDAQDEYEDLAPLGVGKHKFEVYFNRPMNKAVAPQISFGVRDPYTQNAVNEDGSWNAEGTIYTAYKTITGKTKSDGVNRIYVYGAEDNEFFECPYEKTRFNVMINAAGSMATGFAGEAQMGRVKLTWDNSENNFNDAMGFNVYRYQLDADNNEINNTRINQEIVDIETTEYTDYDVIPGDTYYYMYKVLSTDLQEFDASNVVAVTPLTATLGDANGSGDVDVADVITTVNYAAGMEPKPFIFEAADMNTDQAIDILDVVGIIQKILNPSAREDAMLEATAVYSIENGVLYIETPIALAGVQVQLNMDEKRDVTATESLNGFEQVSAWLSDNDMLFLAYNMNGKTLMAGKHALLKIGNAEVSTLRLSDSQGRNVMVEAGEGTTSIDALGSKVNLQSGIFNLKGQKISGKAVDLQKLPKGVYIINGEKIVK